MKKSLSKGIVLSAVSFLGVFAGSQVVSADTDVTIAKTERQVSKVYLSDKMEKKLPKIVSTSLFKCQLLLTPNQILVLPVLSFTTWRISIIHG